MTPLLVVFGGLRGALFMRATLIAACAAFFAVLGLVCVLIRERVWTFSFRQDRFHADARGEHYEVGMDEIIRFSAERVETKSRRGARLTDFELRIHLGERPTHRLPLCVDSSHEAQFIADRANALLAGNGRDLELGYRGERLQLATRGAGTLGG